jgi:alanine dehydrogenase
VACDDGGAIETCRSTTHDKPVFHEEGVLHYCVDNIPSAFAQTASVTLANSTLPYLLQLANKGFKKAIEDNKYLRAGMTCYGGKLTLRETALKQNREWTDAEELIKVW